MKNVFDQYLSTHFKHVTSRNDRRGEALRANYLALLRGLPADASVLEIGPGNGELLKIIREETQLARVSAVDLSSEVVEACNQQFGGVELVEDTRQYLEQHPRSYDLIILLHVLEHVPKAESVAFLVALNGALRAGGRAVIEVPNMGNPVLGLTSRYADFTHEVGFTEMSLTQVLRMAGFTQVDVHPFRVPRTSPARWVQWLLRLLVEKAFWLLAKLYVARPELNSANIVAVAGSAEPQ